LPNKQGKVNSIYVPVEGQLNRYEENDILIGNIRPYLKKIFQSSSRGGASPDVLIFRAKNKSNVLPRFLFHCLASDAFFNFMSASAKGAKMPRGDKDSIVSFEISVPPLPIQHAIVAILDRFDALTSDLTQGLPAEIAARQQQYAYYRDRLLTFREKSA